MDWKSQLTAALQRTRAAAIATGNLSAGQKNEVLAALAGKLLQKRSEIVAANSRDLGKARAKGLSSAFLDRLTLTPERVEKMARAVDHVRSLPDPVGQIIWQITRPNGLRIERVRVPIGVIAIIYESRPDVTIESAVLCLKSGNCVVLRGGKESRHSNAALVSLIKESLREKDVSEDAVTLVTSGGRSAVRFLLTQNQEIDLVIPRGGESLITAVVKLSRIPVIKHYKGVCHTYIDREADLPMAWEVTFNAKVQRPGTCNATETLLVHRDIAGRFLPEMARRFTDAGVEMRGCAETLRILPAIKHAADDDWGREYLALVIAIRIVGSLAEAVVHINTYGTKHSDAIITSNSRAAEEFFRDVDSACLYHNASTRFTDGGQFGLGAEIGISTDKIHARGPMGLEELTTYKYLIRGNGQLRT